MDWCYFNYCVVIPPVRRTRQAEGLSAACELVELAVGGFDEFDKLTIREGHGCSENEVAGVGNGTCIGGTSPIDRVDNTLISIV